MKILLCLLVINLSYSTALGQRAGQPALQIFEIPTPEQIKGDGQSAIQRVELQDSLIVREIKKLIAEESATKELVRRGLGYVELVINNYDEIDYRFLRKYEFFISFHIPSRSWSNNSYPPFYTYIAGRLVFIHLDGLENTVKLIYSAKSKKQMRKRIDEFLEKPQRVVFRDKQGHKDFIDKNFRDIHIFLHSGKIIYVKRDGSVIVRMANDFSPVK